MGRLTEYETIGQRISATRKGRGLTQVQLAEKLDVNQVSISQWERGICLPRSKRAELARALGIRRSDLFAEIEP